MTLKSLYNAKCCDFAVAIFRSQTARVLGSWFRIPVEK